VSELISLVRHPHARTKLTSRWRPYQIMLAAREHCAMSQSAFARQLADRLGYPQLTPATVRAWEQGKANPPAAAVHAALGLVESSAAPTRTPGEQDQRTPVALGWASPRLTDGVLTSCCPRAAMSA
jgi:DNA-binding transcriptional regulator YiaG